MFPELTDLDTICGRTLIARGTSLGQRVLFSHSLFERCTEPAWQNEVSTKDTKVIDIAHTETQSHGEEGKYLSMKWRRCTGRVTLKIKEQ